MSSLLKCQNLTIGYGKNQVLSNINFEISKPGIYALMGLNGSGKSTFLNTISGHLQAIEGNVFIKDKVLTDFGPSELAIERAIVFSTNTIDYFLSAREVIELGMYSRKITPEQVKEESKQVATLLKIESLLDKNFNELSDGQKQKVLLAKAFVQNTSLILLDEPLNFLDFPGQIELLKILHSDLFKEKLVIYSSHFWPLIKEFSTEILFIDSHKSLNKTNTAKICEEDFLQKEFNLPAEFL